MEKNKKMLTPEQIASSLNECFCHCFKGCDDCAMIDRDPISEDCESGLVEMAIDLIREQAKRIAELETEKHWIPVAERLPEPMQHIIAVGRNFPWLASPGPVIDTFVYNPYAYQPWMEYITHWMPWPGFPKEVFGCG